MNHEQTVKSLREALQFSPENVPLRKHLAETLLQCGKAEEAENEYKDALARDRENSDLKIGLATAFFQQGKFSHALVIIEELVSRRDTPADAYLLHARLLWQKGDVEFAVTEYKSAIGEDPTLKDDEFEARLGIDADDDAEVKDGRVRAGWESEESTSPVREHFEKPRISFADVGGMQSLKEEIRMKIIYPLEHQEMFKAYGKAIGGGILMYGPPGCGKTHLAGRRRERSRPGSSASASTTFSTCGSGTANANSTNSSSTPAQTRRACSFFDEVDALGAARSDMKTSSARHLVNQFLAEMDGDKASNDGVLILAATNAPWHVDSAFRRPGRFDRILFVPPPDPSARAEVLRLLLNGKTDRQHRPRSCRQEDDRVLGSRPQGTRRSCRRTEADRGDEDRHPQTDHHRRSRGRRQAHCAPRPRNGSPPPATTLSIRTREGCTTTY